MAWLDNVLQTGHLQWFCKRLDLLEMKQKWSIDKSASLTACLYHMSACNMGLSGVLVRDGDVLCWWIVETQASSSTTCTLTMWPTSWVDIITSTRSTTSSRVEVRHYRNLSINQSLFDSRAIFRLLVNRYPVMIVWRARFWNTGRRLKVTEILLCHVRVFQTCDLAVVKTCLLTDTNRWSVVERNVYLLGRLADYANDEQYLVNYKVYFYARELA